MQLVGVEGQMGFHPVVWNKLMSPKTPLAHDKSLICRAFSHGTLWAGTSSDGSVQ